MRSVFAMQESPLMQLCFGDGYGYSKCCRLAQDPWMQQVMQPACWPAELGVGFEQCCFFRFGPTVRGLPFNSEDDVIFDFRQSVGELILEPHPDIDFWPTGWIFAQLLVDVRQARRKADALGWSGGAERLARLPDRPLRVLDVSCGAGLSSIAGARANHNVTCTEVSTDLLQLAGRNAARNRAQLHLRKWDVQSVPWPRRRERFDLCLLDLTYFNHHFRQLQLGGHSDVPFVSEVLPFALQTLRSDLGTCCLYAFSVVASDGMKVISEGLADEMAYSNFTVELLRSLAEPSDAQGRDLLRDCGAAPHAVPAQRPGPSISPLGWLEDAGWTPPIFYHLILW